MSVLVNPECSVSLSRARRLLVHAVITPLAAHMLSTHTCLLRCATTSAASRKPLLRKLCYPAHADRYMQIDECGGVQPV
jgi:hypothetical protein